MNVVEKKENYQGGSTQCSTSEAGLQVKNKSENRRAETNPSAKEGGHQLAEQNSEMWWWG